MRKSVFTRLILLVTVVAVGLMVGLGGCTNGYNSEVEAENLMKGARVIAQTEGNARALFSYGSWVASNERVQFAEIQLKKRESFNTIAIKEVSHAVKKFKIYAEIDGVETLIYQNDKIEDYRYCTFQTVASDRIKFEITEATAWFSVHDLAIYNVPPRENGIIVNEYVAIEKDFEYTDLIGNKAYSDMLDVVTDVTFMGGFGIAAGGAVTYHPSDIGQTRFEREFAAFLQIVGERDINIYLNVYSDTADISSILDQDGDKLIASYLALAEKYDIAGFDFDWEYPQNNAQWKAFSRFLVKFKTALNAKGLKLMIATASWCKGLTAEAIDAIDYINVMLYDGRDKDGYHSSFEYYVEGAMALLKLGAKKEQLLLGLPFYGRDTDNGGKHINFKDSPITDRWTNVVKDIQYMDKEGKSQTKDFFFNGYQMIADKTAYASDLGFAGVMTWQYNADKPFDQELSLHKAIAEGVARK